jgi:hypothetical protein
MDMLAHEDFTSGEPACIVLEPAFEAYQRVAREEFIEAARNSGHELRRITDRITPRVRRHLKETLWGEDCPEKSWTKKDQWYPHMRHLTGVEMNRLNDEYDTRAIWHAVVTLGKSTSPVFTTEEIRTRRGDDWLARSAHANRQAVNLRFMDLKPGWNDLLVSKLGEPRTLDRWLADALGVGIGKEYATFVPSCWLAAGTARTRDEYEALLGLHQNGWASMLRSEVHHWGWKGLIKRRPEMTWRQYRKALRWFYHQVKDLPHPEIVE